MSAASPIAPTGPLEGIRHRIARFTAEIHDLASKLETHAANVHGSKILGDVKQLAEEVADRADGELPMLHRALDDCEHAISRIAHAAGLNTTLA